MTADDIRAALNRDTAEIQRRHELPEALDSCHERMRADVMARLKARCCGYRRALLAIEAGADPTIHLPIEKTP